MVRMAFKPIPAVNPDHIIEAHQKVVADRERLGSSDVTISCVSLFSGRMKPQKILDITHRLFALARFLEEGEAKEWVMEETGTDYILVNEALLRAAARAPLMEAEYIKDMGFEKDTFLPIVLEEAETEGKA
ncbi:MAG: hypothetical protein JWN71_3225 [Xanthobacteraceae bacterium]|nr:hypothetical protein [Xanthobacteraceae bacterium]